MDPQIQELINQLMTGPHGDPGFMKTADPRLAGIDNGIYQQANPSLANSDPGIYANPNPNWNQNVGPQMQQQPTQQQLQQLFQMQQMMNGQK